ncbi:hypothetical protein STEG23_032101 [Scotinomys teguina]
MVIDSVESCEHTQNTFHTVIWVLHGTSMIPTTWTAIVYVLDGICLHDKTTLSKLEEFKEKGETRQDKGTRFHNPEFVPSYCSGSEDTTTTIAEDTIVGPGMGEGTERFVEDYEV